VTCVPLPKAALQVLPQSMPAGCDRTMPSPLSPTFRLRSTGAGGVSGPPTGPLPDPPPQAANSRPRALKAQGRQRRVRVGRKTAAGEETRGWCMGILDIERRGLRVEDAGH
jgi:hypothetical protein